MDLRKLRDKASEAFARGRFAKAAELYAEYCGQDPRDLQARLRMGDAWAKAGDRPKAIAAYQGAAESYAREGFLPRAIAASKLILELDPAHVGVQQMLANLYARKSTGPGTGRFTPKPEVAAPPESARPQRAPIDLPDEPVAPLELDVPGVPDSLQAHPALPPELELFDASTEAPGTTPQPALMPEPVLSPIPAASTEPPGMRRRTTAVELSVRALQNAPVASVDDASPGIRDSLLHAVELAAQAGQSQRGEAPTDVEEEVLSVTADLAPEAPKPDELPRIPLFSDLTPEAFIELFERCPLRRFGAGDRIIAQGSIGDAFYVVCEGRVRVVREEGDSARELATLAEGTFFGEMALLSGAPRSAAVESASDDTQVLEISAPVLTQLSHRFPSVATALKKFCRQRMLSNVMKTSALFKPFGKSDRRTLMAKFRARGVNEGDAVIREGAQTDGLYIVLSGEMEVVREGQVLARLHEGELFGEMSLLKKADASATVRATRRTSLIRLPRADFDALILSHPQILILVSELTDDRQRQNDAVLGGAAEMGDEGLVLV